MRAIAGNGANAILICALDELAWLLNIRGNDVTYNPVAVGFAYFSTSYRILFMNDGKISNELAAYLHENGIEQRPYNDIYKFLQELPAEEQIFIDPNKTNYKLVNILPSKNKTILGVSPVTWLKSIKNETEMQGRRAAMVRDGAAMVQFLYWLDTHIGKEDISELDIAEKLREFRSKQALYKGESFGTIAGYREHGAIVHYSASPESNSLLKPEGFVLVDSGAQYLDGTTDITRTLYIGEPTPEEKRAYTAVLKAHIAIERLVFPAGYSGPQLDAVARSQMWALGYNYGHGTGHGVGAAMNVHEGPISFGNRGITSGVPFEPGMVISDEPGYYKTGGFGIRIENCVTVREAFENEHGRFLGIEPLTLAPIETKLVEVSLLSDQELEWLNGYHAHVREKVLPLLEGEDARWLTEKCRPLTR